MQCDLKRRKLLAQSSVICCCAGDCAPLHSLTACLSGNDCQFRNFVGAKHWTRLPLQPGSISSGTIHEIVQLRLKGVHLVQAYLQIEQSNFIQNSCFDPDRCHSGQSALASESATCQSSPSRMSSSVCLLAHPNQCQHAHSAQHDDPARVGQTGS